MKKVFFMLAIICVATTVNAQLLVNNSGNVHISNIEHFDTISVPDGTRLYVTRSSIANWGTCLYARSNNDLTAYSVGVRGEALHPSNYPQNFGRAYGIMGIAGHAQGGYNYGVYGELRGNNNGAAIYGTTNNFTNGLQVNGYYAGYFDGDAKVTYSLEVEGGIYDALLLSSAPSPLGSSGYIVETLSERGSMQTADRLASLQGVTYYPAAAGQKSDSSERPVSAVARQRQEKLHHGIDIETLESEFPEFVYEKEDGTKMIDYIGMVPVLIQALSEMNSRMAALEGRDAMMSRGQNATTGVLEVEAADIITLSQNDPNPWSSQTAIRMNIPERVKDAAIFIYDMSGKQVAEHRISGRGDTALTLTAETLVPGMYIYTLIADGKVISTKRMILTK